MNIAEMILKMVVMVEGRGTRGRGDGVGEEGVKGLVYLSAPPYGVCPEC